MAEIIEISDFSSPYLDLFARLTEQQLRNKLEEEKGVFIAESPKVIRLALSYGYTPAAFLMPKKHLLGQGKEFLALGAPVYTAEEEVLEKLTGYRLTRAVLAAFYRPKKVSPESILSTAKRVAVLEDITDATNLGAIVRSAAALKMDGVLLSPSCCDPLNRRAVRVSMGTIFQLPWAWLGEEPSFWPESGMALLKKYDFATAAMALSENSVRVDDERLKREEKLAIILGTEGDGLKKETIARADYTVKIPMARGVDSLNVAAASAVAFWEFRLR